MQRRYNLADFLLASVVVLVLTLLMVVVDAQAQITFGSNREGNWDIYVMDNDGGNPRNLTNNRHGDYSPSWSPDGNRIVFSSDRDGHVIDGRPTDEIYVMDVDGGNPRRLTNHRGDDGYPSWSPDGNRIVFWSDRDGNFNFEIYVMDADGGNPQNLTNNPNLDWNPSWSPDGKRIVFDSVRDGNARNDFEINAEIYVMDADGQNQRRLTNHRGDDGYPSWSPDGERIAFMSERNGNAEIYVMDADGGNQQRLTNHRSDDHSPSWSPGGERIAFSSNRGGDFEIYVMDADGGNPQNLTNNHQSDGSPAWFGPAFVVAPAGKKFTMWGWLKQIDR